MENNNLKPVLSKNPLDTIRRKCIDCSYGSSYEVKLCSVSNCVLYLWRFGKNPNPSKRKVSPKSLSNLKLKESK